MTLREIVHGMIEQLDDEGLLLVQERIKNLLPLNREPDSRRVPTIEEVWEMTSHDKSCWSDDISEEREDRF